MTKLYRPMRKDPRGRPERGTGRRTLGVLIVSIDEDPDGDFSDIRMDSEGVVHPSIEGLSVAPDSLHNLTNTRLPEALGGKGKDPVWVIDEDALGDGLAFVPDETMPRPYGVVAPAYSMDAAAYVDAISATQDTWEEVPEEDYNRE